MDCAICGNELSENDKLVAFAEFKPTEYDWRQAKEFDEFDEIIPEEDGWFIAHWWCMFKHGGG